MTDQALSSTPYNTRPSWKVERSPAIPRVSHSRKGPKARTWTPKEEEFLLQSRESRIPYKRIAAQLAKSELACRLHYHQLTVARQRRSYPSPSSGDEYDSYTHRTSYSSPPMPPESQIPVYSHSLPTTSQPLPSLASLLPPHDDQHHRRRKSLPRYAEECGCSSCYRGTPDLSNKPILPPPQGLLSPFEYHRAQQAQPHGSSWVSPALSSKSSMSSYGHHRSASSVTSTSASGIGSWTPLASRSPSVSSIHSFFHPSPSLSCGSVASNGERCSVRSILNPDARSTIL